MDFKALYTTFDGRISRKPYWIGTLLLVGVILIVWWGIAIFVSPFGTSIKSQAVLQLVFTAIIIYPLTAVMVKRLHDRNRPSILAAVYWAPSFAQIIGDLLGITGGMSTLNGTPVYLPNTLGWIILAITMIIGIWALIELGFLRGTDGPNDYGPDPLQ